MATITDVACDLRDHGWTDAATSAYKTRAICVWTRGAEMLWALVDTTDNRVLGGTAVATITRGAHV